VRALCLSNASPVLSRSCLSYASMKSVNRLYGQSHDSTMQLLETSEAQERVDVAHHNVYNMPSMGRAWLVLRTAHAAPVWRGGNRRFDGFCHVANGIRISAELY
jgi:hypothetical protein